QSDPPPSTGTDRSRTEAARGPWRLPRRSHPGEPRSSRRRPAPGRRRQGRRSAERQGRDSSEDGRRTTSPGIHRNAGGPVIIDVATLPTQVLIGQPFWRDVVVRIERARACRVHAADHGWTRQWTSETRISARWAPRVAAAAGEPCVY